MHQEFLNRPVYQAVSEILGDHGSGQFLSCLSGIDPFTGIKKSPMAKACCIASWNLCCNAWCSLFITCKERFEITMKKVCGIQSYKL